jgi:hypothetical protein
VVPVEHLADLLKQQSYLVVDLLLDGVDLLLDGVDSLLDLVRFDLVYAKLVFGFA